VIKKTLLNICDVNGRTDLSQSGCYRRRPIEPDGDDLSKSIGVRSFSISLLKSKITREFQKDACFALSKYVFWNRSPSTSTLSPLHSNQSIVLQTHHINTSYAMLSSSIPWNFPRVTWFFSVYTRAFRQDIHCIPRESITQLIYPMPLWLIMAAYELLNHYFTLFDFIFLFDL